MYEHLFSTQVRETMESAGYGSWRSIDAPDAVQFAFGFPFPDSFPNDELVAAAEGLFEEEGDVALQYTGGEYAAHLTDVVAGLAAERGVDCEPDDVVLTNGSTHAIDVVCRAFLDPGDEILVESPTFMGALSLFETHAASVTGVPMDADGMDVDVLAETLEARDAAGEAMPTLCYTIPTFQNPTGTTLPRERRERLLDLAERYDFVVLEDDAYGLLRFEGEPEPTLKALDDEGRVVRVGTFSKTIAPGVRTGWILADEEIRTQLDRLNAGGRNTFTQGVVAHYCTEGPFESNVADLRLAYETRRDRLLDALEREMPEDAMWTEPEGGFFVWLTLPGDTDAAELLPAAGEAGATYLPGEHFYPDDRSSSSLRLSFSYAPLDELDRGIAALADALDDTR